MKTEKNTVDLTVRGFSRDVDTTLNHVSILLRKPKSVLIRELVEEHFTDRINTFGLLSTHVAALDEMLARHLGAELIERPYETHLNTQSNLDMRDILNIRTDEDLERILVNNTPYITVRADQVVKGFPRTVKGTALWFALFAEVASSSPETVLLAWKKIFYSYNGDAYYRFYKHINEIRVLKGKEKIAADLHDVAYQGGLCTIKITKPDDYQYGAWHAVIILMPEATQIDPEAMRGLRFPTLANRLIIAERDSPYHAVAYSRDREPDNGFAFAEGRCELDIYSTGCDEDYNLTLLVSVAEALVAVTDERLKPFID